MTTIKVKTSTHIQFIAVRKEQPKWLRTLGKGWAA